jgi:predicted SnoaL-like aldol condensation-catalyzing enzyme
MRSLLATVYVAALLSGSAVAQLPVETAKDQPALLDSDDASLAANKRLVFDFWRVVRQAHQVDRAAEYLADDYVGHDPNAPASRAELIALLGQSPPTPVEPTIDDLVSIVAERDLVVLAFRRELLDLENEGQTYTTTGFEQFRVANGKIVEHWSYGTKD